MLKKNEVLEILDNGGHITLCDVYRSANVYDAAGEHIDTCRFDTAERIGSMAAYTVRSGRAWSYTRYIENTAAIEAAREAAAEELESITTPGNIVLMAKADGYCGSYRIHKGRRYIVTVYGDGSHDVPGNAYGKLYDFRADLHAIYFEIVERPEEPEEEPDWDAISARVYASVSETFRNMEAAGVISDLEIEPITAEQAATLEAPQEADPQTDRPVKVYHNTGTGERSESAAEAMSWHRGGAAVRVDTLDAYWGETLRSVTISGAVQERNAYDKNWNHCRSIAEEADAYAAGAVCRCPECGEILHLPDDVGDRYRCPHCGEVSDLDDLERLSMWDYLADCLDVEYRCGSDREYRSVRIMVAWGGPNIYLDTASKAVELYWWNESARYFLSDEAVDALDEWAAEYWGCI